MKGALVILIIALFMSSLCAQGVMQYYQRINEGKAFAIENDFHLAVKAYRSAFQGYDHPYARDCYNAVELSVAAKDTITLQYFLQLALLRGIRTGDIEASGVLKDYLSSHFYLGVKEGEDSLRAIYTSRIDWKLRAEINQIFTEDQRIRAEYYAANIFKRRRIGREWEACNARQVGRLIEITKQYGFPGENLIGLDQNEIHPKISSSSYSAGMPIVIFIHHFSKPNASFDALLLEELKKGNLYNEHFATICDFQAAFGKGQYVCAGYYGLRHSPKKAKVDALDSRREQIGILGIGQIKRLNRVKGLTKFWNRLY